MATYQCQQEVNMDEFLVVAINVFLLLLTVALLGERPKKRR